MATLDAILAATMQASVVAFSLASMLAAGLASPLRELIQPLRRPRGVLVALLANFVIVPALGFILVHALALDRPAAVGLLLVATAAGAPFLVNLTTSARGDVALGAALLALLLPVTIVYMPLVLPLLAPEASVSAWVVARPLLLTMLLPLALGVLLRERLKARPDALLQGLKRLTTGALLLLVASAVAGNVAGIRDLLGARALVAAALLVPGAFAAGYVLSTRGPEGRTVLGLGTAQRNVSAALVVATQAVRDPASTLMVVVASLIGLGILFPLAWWLRRRTERRESPWRTRAGRTS